MTNQHPARLQDTSGEGLPTLRVAVLGAGTVGTEVLRLITKQGDDLAHRIGGRLEVIGVAVRDLARDRGVHVDPALLTEDASALVRQADLVIELMGGIEPARSLILEAMEHGAAVVTANKALLAQDGATLYEAADRHGVDLSFEAAVAGAIPLVRPVRESLAGDRIDRMMGIVNGTTNYILDAMARTGASFDDALATAQQLGYAEADPTADVEGHDAAAKASILASLAFHSRVRLADVHCEGITSVSDQDIAAAERMGRTIKLLSIVERVPGEGGERISARVYPALIPSTHPLASVSEAFNAVFIEADAAGSLMFYGQGAGGAPTASAVLGDVVTAARQRLRGGVGLRESHYAALELVPLEELRSAFYVSLRVQDRPGVLAEIAGTLSKHGISISTIHQQLLEDDLEPAEGSAAHGAGTGSAHIGITTHRALESAMTAVLDVFSSTSIVLGVDSVLRIEGE
ncbi:homoserine dehydrogenase [Brachybacterium muris]|uniref:Homoserine dehydrogenase n=1 Tax=Brachybacterium muris UCD-AY4 TaxID=1249481 RepID=A0A022KUP4_9MICO|nr:homoserine dehydrogenase [Brachybacterium muris]EYT48189.1 homoserine dehydrogenase [Brachybacterium muris UCD-AY4]MBM7501064.1 homoserine dehydrogenase [Brachybacterium muris]MCT1653945.1 homoserine dehydrogenase [Brachybacterium muris]MCT1998176.1 homoserine dehydrogenase [Brachybacterium muris]MCT2178692.1 homoserine dehydrogenase [Brachybacterium muris]